MANFWVEGNTINLFHRSGPYSLVEINPYLTSFEDGLGVVADGDGLVGEVVHARGSGG